MPQKTAFDEAEKYKNWLTRTEWLAIPISIAGTLLSFLPKYSNECSVVFTSISLLLIIGVFFLQQRLENTYRNAESIRRDGLIDFSYHTALADVESENYYDTEEIEVGLRKLLANIHENSFFSSKIIDVMYKKEEVKSIMVFLILAATAIASSVTSQTFIAILQTFLSMSFLGNYFRLHNLKNDLDSVQTKCKAIWENLKQSKKKTICMDQQALIIREVIRYETALSYASTMLDKKLYEKVNPSATAEWEDLRKRCAM